MQCEENRHCKNMQWWFCFFYKEKNDLIEIHHLCVGMCVWVCVCGYVCVGGGGGLGGGG